jgi:hypothetical protein
MSTHLYCTIKNKPYLLAITSRRANELYHQLSKQPAAEQACTANGLKRFCFYSPRHQRVLLNTIRLRLRAKVGEIYTRNQSSRNLGMMREDGIDWSLQDLGSDS